jgi:hypothetical protein
MGNAGKTDEVRAGVDIPPAGARIERLESEMGVNERGTVFYSDQLQILVKWDNGRSQSLTPGVDRFRIMDRDQPAPSSEGASPMPRRGTLGSRLGKPQS